MLQRMELGKHILAKAANPNPTPTTYPSAVHSDSDEDD
jgi:hypothetical protein